MSGEVEDRDGPVPRSPLRSLPEPCAAALPSCQAGIRAQGGDGPELGVAQKGLLVVSILPGGADPASLCFQSQTSPPSKQVEVRVRLKIELPSCRGSEGVMGNGARRPQRGVDPCSSRGSLVIPPPRRPASHPHPHPRVPASSRAGSHCKVIFLSNDAVHHVF